MKIVHILSCAPFGGTESQCEWLALALHGAGVAQRIILAGDSERISRLSKAGVDVVEMELKGLLGFLVRRKIEAELGRFAPDIVLSWRPDVSSLVTAGSFAHIGRLPAQFDIKAYHGCTGLLAPSKGRADAAVAAGWAADKIIQLPNLPSPAGPRGDVAPFERRKLFTPATAKIVFSAGRLEKSKSFDVLIDAVARLSGVYLWIAGDGPDRAAFEAHALNRGIKPRVRFLGWQEDLRPYFAASDLFVYPAKQEDLGDAVVEAWQAGVPVIAADSIGPGLLIRHQENGVLVPVGDAVAMADAITWLLGDRRAAKDLGLAGRAAFERDFAHEHVVKRYHDAFAAVCKTPDPPVAPAPSAPAESA
ncbi:MAG: glycosyltransferase [Rhodospirillaceae bacterium]|nr:glycosyltransferase [Rhodospirillaceae bacterium]